jgi:soluble lytic murein transglycosylase-like protein
LFRLVLDRCFLAARRRCLTVLTAAALAPVAPAVIAAAGPQLDADTCAALAADAGRLGSKYMLGQRACGAAAAMPAAAAVPRAHQSQQLYLYESPVEAPPLMATPMPRVRPAAVPSAPPVGTPQPARQPLVKTPSRTISRSGSPSGPPSGPPSAGERALRLAPAIAAVARQHDIDPLLLHAIARVESRHDVRAVSSAGARGVMQVMPATGRRFGVTDERWLHHAQTNLAVSAAYLKTLQGRFGNDLTLVLAAYNAGEGAVERHGRRVPPYAETQRYVRDVGAEYERLRGMAPRAAGGGWAVASAPPGRL